MKTIVKRFVYRSASQGKDYDVEVVIEENDLEFYARRAVHNANGRAVAGPLTFRTVERANPAKGLVK